jgi:hypothetical protein
VECRGGGELDELVKEKYIKNIIKIKTMKRKISTLILSGLLLASFFVPFVKWENFTMSGFDFVVSSYPPDIKYILLLVPGCALCLLVSALIDGATIINSKLLLRVPLIALILLFFVLYSTAENRIALGSSNPLYVFFPGFWAALTISLILPNFRKKHSNLLYKLPEGYNNI